MDYVGVDVERLGKADRQTAIKDARINKHELSALAALRKAAPHARLWARLNPLHSGSANEIEMALNKGATVLTQPQFTSGAEVEEFRGIVNGRARTIPLLEDAKAIDDLGLTCMREWAADCFKWCYAKVEDGKFMNQGYLTRWPSRYPGIVSLTHPGLNLAPWNFDGRTLVKTGDELTINGEPLIFYHFHNMQRSDGVWRNASTLVDRDGHSNLFEYIYDPHSDLLASVEEKLAAMGMDVDALAKDKLSPAT